MSIFVNAVELFHKGGLIMYPLMACSIIVVSIAIERFAYYRQADVEIERFINKLQSLLDREDWGGASALCEQSGVVGEVLARGLTKRFSTPRNLENVLEGAAAGAVARLRDRLGYLDTIVTLAPLLGLLGTVFGMITTFSVLDLRSAQAQTITGGVGEALIATASGLCIAIVALVVHSYFTHRLERIIVSLEQGCSLLVENLTRSIHEHETA